MYNNPYLYQNLSNSGLLSKFFRGAGSGVRAAGSGINWGNLLSNTQKSLGIINQAIPLVYQVKPIVNNAKTMFKIAGALKDDKNIQTNKEKENSNNNNIVNYKNNENGPIFYI